MTRAAEFPAELGSILEGHFSPADLMTGVTRAVVEHLPYEICEIFLLEEATGHEESVFVRRAAAIKPMDSKTHDTFVLGPDQLDSFVRSREQAVASALHTYLHVTDLRQPGIPAERDEPKFRRYVCGALQNAVNTGRSDFTVDINRYPTSIPSATQGTGVRNNLRREALASTVGHPMTNFLYLVAYEAVHGDMLPTRNGIPRLQNMLIVPLVNIENNTIGRFRLMNKYADTADGIRFRGFSERDRSTANMIAAALTLKLTQERPVHRRVETGEIRRVIPPSAEHGGVSLSIAPGSAKSAAGEIRLVGKSQYHQTTVRDIKRCAKSNRPVLITGESGTGKEIVAQAVHYLSERRRERLVELNCATVPGELLESELFGHKKGAFTGAHADKDGRFKIADGGSIFLDEIGDMPLRLQAKLLRAIENGVIDPLGSTKSIPVDVRIIAATHRDLNAMIKDGDFREDLYYRLDVLRINCRPLRQRRDDIEPLANFFLWLSYSESGRALPTYTPGFLAALEDYDYPGNIREIRNIIERVAVYTDFRDELDESDLKRIRELRRTFDGARRDAEPVPDFETYRTRQARRDFEYGVQVLRAAGGNQARAAQLIGQDGGNFHRWWKRVCARAGEDPADILHQIKKDTSRS
ncbi:MAG: sigma 54-interacting transcriptional regulator [bacterium]